MQITPRPSAACNSRRAASTADGMDACKSYTPINIASLAHVLSNKDSCSQYKKGEIASMFTCMSSLQRWGRLASMPVSCHCAASLPGAAALHSR